MEIIFATSDINVFKLTFSPEKKNRERHNGSMINGGKVSLGQMDNFEGQST